MVQPPVREPLDKIVHKPNGGLFILCDNQQYAGLYAASLGDVLNCSLEKAEFIINLIEELAMTHEFATQHQVTDLVFSLSEVIPDPPNPDNRYDYIDNAQSFLAEPLITIEEVAQILEVTYDFAKTIFNAFKKPLNTEETLDEFILYIDSYLKTHFRNGIPDIHKNVKPPEIPPTEAVEGAITESVSDTAYLTQSPYFEFGCQTIAELLEIPLNEATLLLSSPQSLATFLEHDTVTEVKKILDDLSNGDLQPLLNAIEIKMQSLMDTIEATQIEASLADISPQDYQEIHIPQESISETETETEIENFIETPSPAPSDYPQETTQDTITENPSEEISEEFASEPVEEFASEPEMTRHVAQPNLPPPPPKKTESDTPEIPLTELPKARPVAEIMDIPSLEKLISPQEETKSTQAQKAPQEMPTNVSDMLRYVFGRNQRITAKSLAETFKIFGVDISQSLARFIIEEGGYAAEAPNNNRIMSIDTVEKLITDIDQHENLKAFVKIYLTKVNDDLKSIIANGGGGA